MTELKAFVAAQRGEIARLKGLKGRPSIKLSGMQTHTEPPRSGKGANKRRRGKVTPGVKVETEVLWAAHLPGSQFNGYEPDDVPDLVIDQQDDFLIETDPMQRAGLARADRTITVGDMGGHHRGANVVCAQIGNDNFAWFGTTGRKSRLNCLSLLRAGHTDYVLNDAAPDYKREHNLAGPLVARFADHALR